MRDGGVADISPVVAEVQTVPGVRNDLVRCRRSRLADAAANNVRPLLAEPTSEYVVALRTMCVLVRERERNWRNREQDAQIGVDPMRQLEKTFYMGDVLFDVAIVKEVLLRIVLPGTVSRRRRVCGTIDRADPHLREPKCEYEDLGGFDGANDGFEVLPAIAAQGFDRGKSFGHGARRNGDYRPLIRPNVVRRWPNAPVACSMS